MKFISKLYLSNNVVNEVEKPEQTFPNRFPNKGISFLTIRTNSLTKSILNTTFSVPPLQDCGKNRLNPNTRAQVTYILRPVLFPTLWDCPLDWGLSSSSQNWDVEVVGIFTTQVILVLKLVLRVLILLKIVLEEDCAMNNKFRQCW